MRAVRLTLVILLTAMIAGGTAAHFHNHPFTNAHGSIRTAGHCGFCIAGAGQAIVTSAAALTAPAFAVDELRHRPVLPPLDSIRSAAVSRAPPLF